MPSVQQPFISTLKEVTKDKHLQPNENKALEPEANKLNLNEEDRKLLNKVLNLVEKRTKTGWRLFRNDVLDQHELAKANQLLGKISDADLSQKVQEILAEMVSEPVDKNKTEPRAKGTFTPNEMQFNKKEDVSKWHTTQFSSYEKEYQRDYFSDWQNKSQFSGKQRNLLDQAASSCGPTCTLMLLKSNGMGEDIQSIGQMRKAMHQIDSRVRADKRGIDPEPIAKTLNTLSKGKLNAKVHRAYKENLKTAGQMIERMKTDLSEGKQVILLSQFMDNVPDRHQGSGHYVVVTHIDSANNLTLADPYARVSQHQVSFEEYQSEFNHRSKKYGFSDWEKPNAYISVAKKEA